MSEEEKTLDVQDMSMNMRFVRRMEDPYIETAFTYHPPRADQTVRYEQIRAAAKNLAYIIMDCCPPSPERSIAHRKLEETVMWANSSIARTEARMK